MKKMRDTKDLRLMHVVLSLGVGGAEKLVYDMMRHSSFRSSPPVVCCLQMVGPLGEKLRKEGFKVYYREKKRGFDAGTIFWLRDVMRRERINALHAHQYTPMFYAVPAARLAGGVRVVYTEHGRLHPDRRRWKRYLFNPLLAMGIDHIVSISDSTRLAMARFDNFPLRRIKVVHNGVDLAGMLRGIDPQAKRRSLGLSEKCRLVGTAARLEDIKNFPMMFRAFRRVLESVPDACLLIAGRGPREKELKALAEQMGIAGHVKFLGLRYDLPEIYPLFEVFLLSSFTEGISVTLLEAMSNGLPAVVTDVGGNSEVVVEGVTGSLVPLEDDAAMAGRIIDLLGDPGLASRLGRKGRERVKEQFSFQGMMGDYRSLYQA